MGENWFLCGCFFTETAAAVGWVCTPLRITSEYLNGTAVLRYLFSLILCGKGRTGEYSACPT